jgi:Trypsin-like peptidase domain
MRWKTAVVWVAIVAGFGALANVSPRAQDRAANAAARDARLRSARGQLAELLGGSGVEGRLFERFTASYVFSPVQPDLPQAQVSNPEDVAQLAVGPLLQVWGQLDERGALTVAKYSLKRPPAPDPAEAAVLPQVVRAATTNLFAALEGALKPGAMSVTTRSLDDPSPIAQETRTSIAAFRRAYRQALQQKADEKVITAIVREWARSRTTVADMFSDSDDHKALYGPPDNYDPWRYDVIFRQSRAVVALGEPGNSRARCSGVLIAADLVLTAGHCFGGNSPKPPKELEVWFDYARAPSGPQPTILRRPVVELVAPSPKRLPDMMAGVFDSELLDYAIIRFAAPPGQPLVPKGISAPCLRGSPPSRNDPVYVVGYPRGEPVMVHDSARVYLPHRVLDGELFFQLRLDVDADLIESPERAAFLRQFDESYETVKEANDITYRYFYHVKDGNQPRMGIIADTFRGNSGGPVYDRERGQCVVGTLIAGADDTGMRLTASWKHHERVLPISAVLEDAERHAPGIRKKLNMENE